MRTDTQTITRLENYRPTDYLIETVKLDIRLDAAAITSLCHRSGSQSSSRLGLVPVYKSELDLCGRSVRPSAPGHGGPRGVISQSPLALECIHGEGAKGGIGSFGLVRRLLFRGFGMPSREVMSADEEDHGHGRRARPVRDRLSRLS